MRLPKFYYYWMLFALAVGTGELYAMDPEGYTVVERAVSTVFVAGLCFAFLGVIDFILRRTYRKVEADRERRTRVLRSNIRGESKET